MYSGLAVAEEWAARGGEVFFVGTPYGLEKELVPRYKFPLELIEGRPFKGGKFWEKVKTVMGIPKAVSRSFFLLARIDPDVVLGIGGYASGPVVLASCLKRVPTALLDQNSVPGMTNRILGKWARRIFLNFEEAQSHFKREKVKITGNPVISARRANPVPLLNKGMTILVCGGSQGARRLNQKMVEAYEMLAPVFPNLQIFHQTGVHDYSWVCVEAQKVPLKIVVAPFFDDMEKKYAASRLVISRAGAGTLTELAQWGLPSLLVPYPFAADDHQRKNSEVFEKMGACEIIDQNILTGELLAEKISGLLKNEERLVRMSQQARKLAKPDAAKEIVDELMRMAEITSSPSLEGRG